jgi:hypothetical protein
MPDHDLKPEDISNDDWINDIMPTPKVAFRPREILEPPPAPVYVPKVRWLTDYAKDPELLDSPAVLIPHLAWRGRLTLLAAEEKSGKSTLVGQGVAAMTKGDYFLGEQAAKGKVLWIAMDEPVHDAVARLVHHEADPSRVGMIEEPINAKQLESVLNTVKPDLIIVDTLVEWAQPQVPDFNSAHAWTPVIRALRTELRKRDCGAILLHHVNKANTAKYADSRQIGASVDNIIEMIPQAGRFVASRRQLNIKGRRIGHYQLVLNYEHAGYRLC